MDFSNFLYTLPFMVKGMAGIFIVTLFIILCIYILNKLTAHHKDDNEKKE